MFLAYMHHSVWNGGFAVNQQVATVDLNPLVGESACGHEQGEQ